MRRGNSPGLWMGRGTIINKLYMKQHCALKWEEFTSLGKTIYPKLRCQGVFKGSVQIEHPFFNTRLEPWQKIMRSLEENCTKTWKKITCRPHMWVSLKSYIMDLELALGEDRKTQKRFQLCKVGLFVMADPFKGPKFAPTDAPGQSKPGEAVVLSGLLDSTLLGAPFRSYFHRQSLYHETSTILCDNNRYGCGLHIAEDHT